MVTALKFWKAKEKEENPEVPQMLPRQGSKQKLTQGTMESINPLLSMPEHKLSPLTSPQGRRRNSFIADLTTDSETDGEVSPVGRVRRPTLSKADKGSQLKMTTIATLKKIKNLAPDSGGSSPASPSGEMPTVASLVAELDRRDAEIERLSRLVHALQGDVLSLRLFVLGTLTRDDIYALRAIADDAAKPGDHGDMQLSPKAVMSPFVSPNKRGTSPQEKTSSRRMKKKSRRSILQVENVILDKDVLSEDEDGISTSPLGVEPKMSASMPALKHAPSKHARGSSSRHGPETSRPLVRPPSSDHAQVPPPIGKSSSLVEQSRSEREPLAVEPAAHHVDGLPGGAAQAEAARADDNVPASIHSPATPTTPKTPTLAVTRTYSGVPEPLTEDVAAGVPDVPPVAPVAATAGIPERLTKSADRVGVAPAQPDDLERRSRGMSELVQRERKSSARTPRSHGSHKDRTPKEVGGARAGREPSQPVGALEFLMANEKSSVLRDFLTKSNNENQLRRTLKGSMDPHAMDIATSLHIMGNRKSKCFQIQEGYFVEDGPMVSMVDTSNQQFRLDLEHYCWYEDYFVGKDHLNYVGYHPSVGAIVISTIKEGWSTDNPTYRLIARTKEGDQKVLIPAKSVDIGWRSSSFRLLNAANPLFANTKFNIIDSVALEEDLLSYERKDTPKKFKFGVLYAKEGQATEEDMFSNAASPAFEEFLSLVGDVVELNGFDGFTGGLDVKANTTGRNSVYCQWGGFEVMFHVSTMLPFSETNNQQIERKRFIGNDIAIILFQEGTAPIQPSIVQSAFIRILFITFFWVCARAMHRSDWQPSGTAVCR